MFNAHGKVRSEGGEKGQGRTLVWLGAKARHALPGEVHPQRVDGEHQDVQPEVELEAVEQHGGVHVPSRQRASVRGA